FSSRHHSVQPALQLHFSNLPDFPEQRRFDLFMLSFIFRCQKVFVEEPGRLVNRDVFLFAVLRGRTTFC
ncbi:hypothetical protein NQ253_25635, partial [Escherichia coli]|nr:hypothetical protein [Escherichia coli]